MGAAHCSQCKPGNDRLQECEDPPVSAFDEEPPHPAPITVDLVEPPVDVNAPLDERDIELVQQTFARVAMLGKEAVGWVLFMNIFEIAPAAKGLFPFKDEEDHANSTRMKMHASRVVSTLATAISLLRDLETLVPVLESLGLRHAGYSVIPEHYDVVGQALIKSLSTALGHNMTPAVTNAYLKVFTIVKATMISKCDYKPAAVVEPEEEAQAPEASPRAESNPRSSPRPRTSPRPGSAPNSARASAESAPGSARGATANAGAKAVEPTAVEADTGQNGAPPTEEKKEAKAAPVEGDDPKKNSPAQEAADETHSKKKIAAESKPKAKKHANAVKKKKAEEPAAVKKTEKTEEAPKKEEASLDEQLFAAAASGNDKEMQKLIKAGANVNFADADGKTALHVAAENGIEEAVGRLTGAKKIKVSAKTLSTKETPLHFAARGGHKDSAVMLARAGCELAAKNKAGKKACDLAKDPQLLNWLQTIESNGNPGGTVPPWQGQKMK